MARSVSADELSAVLSEFFNNSNVGLAVFDQGLRYHRVNHRLASINGLCVEAHLGKTLREVLGDEVASRPEAAVMQVLATGQPIANVEIKGTLPTKTEAERWVDNFFPIRDSQGRVTQVGAIVMQVPAETTPEAEDINLGLTPGATVMRSWKEIADYLGTCVKTAQRWEQTYNLPIRRLRASKGLEVFALTDEVNRWIVSKARSATKATGHEGSWATFTDSALPTLIVDDHRFILDANVRIAELIGSAQHQLVGQKLDRFVSATDPQHIDHEWEEFRKRAGSVGLRNFCRPDGTAFAAEYTLRTLRPGVRIVTLTAVGGDSVSDEEVFYQTGPGTLNGDRD